ncbi:MAG: hypothetical protein AABX08_00790 [Nanoarchaeota archaeon]
MADIGMWLYILGGVAVILIIVIILLLIPKGGKAEKIVKQMFADGKSVNGVLQYAKLKKLNLREVKLYYLLFSVRDFVNKGYKIDEIKSMAQDAGWAKDLIDIVSSRLR